jgi:hypothetical protein
VRLDFTLDGLPGHVDVAFEQVEDPRTVGAWPGSAGLPACEATVGYPGRGYRGLFGWVQLVRSTDNRSGGERFEMDPLEMLGDVPHPFCFFGVRPTLFDAPARDDRSGMTWTAYSFLTHVYRLSGPEVRALLGFSWGFAITAGQVTLVPPAALPDSVWNDQLPTLTASYPTWTFAPGFASA